MQVELTEENESLIDEYKAHMRIFAPEYDASTTSIVNRIVKESINNLKRPPKASALLKSKKFNFPQIK